MNSKTIKKLHNNFSELERKVNEIHQNKYMKAREKKEIIKMYYDGCLEFLKTGDKK